MNFSQQAMWGNYQMTGSNHLLTPNEPNGLEIWFFRSGTLKDEAVITVTDSKGEKSYEQKLKPGAGVGKIYWDTMMVQPGNYTVTITCGSVSESAPGIVLDKWQWPVLNFNSGRGFGISIL